MSKALQQYREQAASALAPFFLEGAHGDRSSAQSAAGTMLDSYNPVTPKEWQLAAQIVAYGFAALACLGSALAVKNLPIQELLDLQDAALALDRLAQKCTKDLEARRRERARTPLAMTPQNMQWDDAGFKAAMSKALAKMEHAASKMPQPVVTPPKRKKPDLRIVSSEPMTSTVLARRGASAFDESHPRNGPRRH